MDKKPSPSEENNPLNFLVSSPFKHIVCFFLTICEYLVCLGNNTCTELTLNMEELCLTMIPFQTGN